MNSGSIPVAGSVSVVMPTHNGYKFVGEALEGISTQTLEPRELIVVDDASTDRTCDLVTAFAQRAPFAVRLIRLTKNSGSPTRPINVAIRAASGEYIAVCDQDDVFCPDKLRQQVAVLDKHPEVACVASLAGVLGQPGEIIQAGPLIRHIEALGEKRTNFVQFPGESALRLLLVYENFIMGYPGFLFRRRDWARKGGLKEEFRICSDYELLCWLSTRGSLALVDRVHYCKRSHAENLSEQHRLLAWIEMTLIKGRLFVREPTLVNKLGLGQELRENLFSLGFKARKMGNYRKAVECHWLSLRLWGYDTRILKELVKLLPHWVCRMSLSLGARIRENTDFRRGNAVLEDRGDMG